MINKIKKLLGIQSTRKVLLVSYNGETKIVTAKPSQAGWMANWYGGFCGLNNTYSILLSDGKTAGLSHIVRWLPHSGWDGTEFIAYGIAKR